MKKCLSLFVFFVICFSFSTNAQINSTKGILVYFVDGVQPDSTMVNGMMVKEARITNAPLRRTLAAIDIPEDSVKPAFPQFNRADTLRVLQDGREIRQADMSRLFRIKPKEGEDIHKIIEQLNSLPEVLYAEPDGITKPDIAPNDTDYSLHQWNMNNRVNPGCDIHAEAAWDIFRGNPTNIIAIVDGGVVVSHPDLNDKISGGDVGTGDGNWAYHGSHVAGIAAAESNNNQGVAGVDWNARIHPQRVDFGGDVETYQAIVDAVNYSPNVFVLNNSYGLVYENDIPGRSSTTVRQAVAYAYKNNRIFVASMGNHQNTHPNVIGYPAGYHNVMAVGSTDNFDVIAGTSVHGSHIDVCAPGVGIYSTMTGDTYGNLSGTSMAAPHVAGLASLLKGYNTNLANDDVMNIIRLSADTVHGMNGNEFTNAYGHGRINAANALAYLRAPYKLERLTAKGGNTISTSGSYKMMLISAGTFPTGVYIVKRVEVQKTITLPSTIYDVTSVWGRGVFTTGWSDSNPNFGEGFCEVVPGSLTSSNVILRTYVYEIHDLLGRYYGYRPNSPSNVTFAYSVLGLETPSISGPLNVCGQATYTINNLPQGATVKWSLSNNILTIVSGQGTGSCIIKKSNDGKSLLKAEITLGTRVIANRSMQISTETKVSINGSTNMVGCGTTRTWSPLMTCVPLDVEGQVKTNWTLESKDQRFFGTGPQFTIQTTCKRPTSNTVLRQPINTPRAFYTLRLKVTYPDGTVYSAPDEVFEIFGYINVSGVLNISDKSNEVNGIALRIFPNPATDMVTVELQEEQPENDGSSTKKTTKAFITGQYEIQLWNASAILKRFVTSQPMYQVSVSGLPAGIYFVRVIKDGQTYTKKLIKR